MNKVSMQINGRTVAGEVAPRTHLGDYLRDTVRLTGTHLGCEHGVCGACTVLLDGEPVRSCITFAVACEGRQVTTIEGYDGDPIMSRLRVAFTRHHALQCGFCTPGMLATSRDIVLRLPDADEARVRIELAGNLCRCTGYMGIVAAVLDVLDQLRREQDPAVAALRAAALAGRTALPRPAGVTGATEAAAHVGFEVAGSAPAGGAAALVPLSATVAAGPAAAAAPSAPSAPSAGAGAGVAGKGTRIEGAFDVPFPAERVWSFMGDLAAVAACLPGASIDSHEGDRVKGRISIRFGPMSAAFVGAARLERDDATLSAVLRGAGQDSLSQSRAQGDVGYRLEALSPAATRVAVDLVYSLQGPLAQFSRSGLVRDFVRRMIADFGRNVATRLASSGAEGSAAAEKGGVAGAGAGTSVPAASMNPVRVLAAILWERLRRALGLGR